MRAIKITTMSTKNLYDREAKSKIKELAEDIDFTMMATKLSVQPIHTIPMSTKKVDDKGSIWFLSGRDSEHNANIQQDGRVQLLYSDPSNMEFLTVYGNALITTDREILEELYGKSDDMWFEGIEDPNLTAICVEPSEAQYWDAKHNKLVSLFKMGVGAITGDQPDLSESGKIVL